MSQYKVPQNVEAEDKILGPLTLKQMIYAMIGVGIGFLVFVTLHSVLPVMIIVGAPPVILFLLLAFYQRDGQNFEQLLIALVGFFSQSRKRIWRKEQVVETFHVEPRAVVIEQTQRNSAEVRSQLEQLGNMVDARGFKSSPSPEISTPNTDYVVNPQPDVLQSNIEVSPPETPDILDFTSSPLAQNLTDMLAEAAKDVREEAIGQMQTPVAEPQKFVPQPVSTSVTKAPSGDILNLATERDDLTVAQLSASANRFEALREGQSVEIRTGHAAISAD